MNVKYKGQTINGIFKMFDEDRTNFLEYFQNKKDDGYYLTANKKHSVRSLEQNNYIHWAFDFIGKELQIPMEYVKSMAKVALLTVPKHEVIKTLVDQYEGEDIDDYQKRLYDINLPDVVRDTSDLEVSEMHKFIDELVPWAMTEFKIAVPYPNEVEV